MKNSKWYLIVFTAIFIAYLGYLCYAHISLKQSQERIICNYEIHLKNAQTIYQDIRNCTMDYIIHADKSHDSIDVIQEKYRNVLYKDSLILMSELAIMEGQTKSMLSLHLDQIEHEYTNITIWAAVIGVLFLVFSFYSLLRIEDCIKKGREGVQIMKGMQQKAKVIIKDIDSAKKAMEAKSSEIVMAFSDNLKLVQTSFEEESNSRLKIFDEYIQRVQKIIIENEQRFSQLNEGGKNE